MKKLTLLSLFPLVVASMALPSARAQDIGSPELAQIFAQGSSPESVAQAVAAAVNSDSSLSPDLVVEVVATFARGLSGVALENAVSEIFRVLAESSPKTVVAALAAVSAKYPALAIASAEGASRGNPEIAREVVAAVLAATPEVDQVALATAVADAAGLEYPVVLGWFSDPMGFSSLPTSAFPGGGGSNRPRPYSD